MPVTDCMPRLKDRWSFFTFGAFSTGIAWIDSTGDNSLIPRFVFGIGEDASLHPESAFAIAPVTVLALLRLQVPKMFKHQDSCRVLLGKLDNASTHQMGDMFINVAYLIPESNIVLFTFCGNAG